MQLAGLPKLLKNDPQTVKFIAASTDVPIMEIVRGISCDIKDSKALYWLIDWIQFYALSAIFQPKRKS